MTLKTQLESISRSELLLLNKSLRYACSEIIGASDVKVRTHKHENVEIYANYDYNKTTIVIYRGSIKNINLYVQTFIHEWTHSRQKGLKSKYHKMNNKYGYRYNPFEVEARNNEKLYKSEVWKITKSIMKNGIN
jgi:hypothetical protein